MGVIFSNIILNVMKDDTRELSP